MKYEVVTSGPTARERVHGYSSADPLDVGDVLRLAGRDWLVSDLEDGDPPRLAARPARYRLRLRRPDGYEEVGAMRRYRPDGPTVGHGFTTLEDGVPVSWMVVEQHLSTDDDGEPFLEFLAERDYGEFDELPIHELEHASEPGTRRRRRSSPAPTKAAWPSSWSRSTPARIPTGTAPPPTSTR